jgi:ribosomal protein S18 acetylase RimI-like enzyme
VGVDMTGIGDGHPDLTLCSGASIVPASPSMDLATARDGTAVGLRPLRRDERELVARFYGGLSAESRRRRFLQPMPRLPEAMLRRLVDVDGRRHVAVVAAVDGECAGIAHAVALADEPGAAEVAVTVTDRFQGRGIGRPLVDALRPAAVRAGLATFVYLVDPTNRPALGLLRSLGVELALRDGLVEGRQHLEGCANAFMQLASTRGAGHRAGRGALLHLAITAAAVLYQSPETRPSAFGIDRLECLLQPIGREAPPLCYSPSTPFAQMQQCQPGLAQVGKLARSRRAMAVRLQARLDARTADPSCHRLMTRQTRSGFACCDAGSGPHPSKRGAA